MGNATEQNDNGDDFFSKLFSIMDNNAAAPAPVEPMAEITEGMTMMFQVFTAAQRAGFSEDQAFQIVLTQISAAFGGEY